MKTIELEGDLKDNVKKSMDQMDAIHAEICALSNTKRDIEKKMWDAINNEIPGLSNNCRISNEKDKTILVDLLAPE